MDCGWILEVSEVSAENGKAKANANANANANTNANAKFYITTAIPYVNASPHIGHALEFVQTDVLARWMKLQGRPTFLTTGADENSLKNVQAAEQQGITTQQLCDQYAGVFKDFADQIGLSWDAFVRSSSKEVHWPGVVKLWQLCDEAGYIYKKKYKGIYCVGCESFLKPSDLVDGCCPEHLKPPEEVEEENYFFALSKFEKKLREMIESDELQVIPQTRKKETLAFIDQGLEDFSISRSVERAKGWGIPVPGDDTQIMYVWYDALTCYLTGVGWGLNERKFGKWWPADVHVIGKGIMRFHTIYWPAMLMAAGLKTPKSVFIHGYVTAEGQKMSKTLGNVVDPIEVMEKYGTDVLRYYLINEIPTFDDGDFSEDRLIEKTNNELIGNFGNFVFRVLSFLKANFNSTVPEPEEFDKEDKALLKKLEEYKGVIAADFARMNLTEAMHHALELSREGNRYFQERKPWEQVKADPEKAANTLYVAANLSRALAIVFWPFVPETTEKLWKQLDLPGEPADQSYDSIDKLHVEPGHRINDIAPLFRKLE